MTSAKKKYVFTLCMVLFGVFGCNYSTRIEPLADASSEKIYRTGFPCIRKREPLTLVVCSNLSSDENKIALFWVEIDNSSSAAIEVNPDAIQLNVTSQKKFVRLQGNAYSAAVNESANERSESWNHTKIPDMVRDERKKIETKREQFLAVAPLMITRNTLDPGQRLEGYVAYKTDTYGLRDVYQKKGETMTLTIPLGQKSEDFQFRFE